MTVTLGHLADMIGGTVLPAESGGPADPPIAAVELNAAETPEGGLFAALPGTRVHGAFTTNKENCILVIEHTNLVRG